LSTSAIEGPKNRFIDPKVLMRIQNLELTARTVVEGFVSGLHKSPYLGFSVDFAEYRPYQPGDELKRIDWNVFGRSDKLYIKLYEGETNTRVLILLDMSGSMAVRFGRGSKDRLRQDPGRPVFPTLPTSSEMASAWSRSTPKFERTFQAARRTGQLSNILKEIDRSEASKETAFKKPLRYLAEVLNRRGIIVVISDFYDEPANIIAGLKALKSKGNDIMAFHIMDDYELTFPFEDMAQFEDLETEQKMHVIPEYLRPQYLSILNKHMEELKKGLSGAQIDYTLMNTSKPLDAGLFSYLAARASSV
jgi:uncharacterized protein (DUF58 family)